MHITSKVIIIHRAPRGASPGRADRIIYPINYGMFMYNYYT